MARFTDRVVLVTGAASGMGAATATALAAEGASVVLFDIQDERVQSVAAGIGGLAVSGDAAREADAQRAVDAATSTFGGLDAVVACAGADVGGGPLGDLSRDDWDQALHANLQTAVVTVRAALPSLLAPGGAVVVIGSIGAYTTGPGIAGYVTAKSALLGLTRSLAVDYGPAGIRVNLVCPGWIDTPMVAEAMDDFARRLGVTAEEAHARATAPLPLRRAGRPEEVAAACLFLLSDDSAFMTGSALVVDGGTLAANVGTAVLD